MSLMPNHVSRPSNLTSSRLGNVYNSEREALPIDETALATHEATDAVTPGEGKISAVP